MGRKLGYAEPKIVRKLIARIWAGKTNRPIWSIAPTSAGGKPRKPYYLTQAQALKVIMRSGTEVADRIQDEIIEVYEAWLNGSLVTPKSFQSQIDELREMFYLQVKKDTSVTAQLDADLTQEQKQVIRFLAGRLAGALGVSIQRPLGRIKTEFRRAGHKIGSHLDLKQSEFEKAKSILVDQFLDHEDLEMEEVRKLVTRSNRLPNEPSLKTRRKRKR